MTNQNMEFTDFAKVAIKVGTVIKVEKITNSQKLYRLEVDLGEDLPRQVIAGLAGFYAPDELLNQQFVFVTNLKPRPIMGYESQAMILAADDGRGRVVLIKPSAKVENGSPIR